MIPKEIPLEIYEAHRGLSEWNAKFLEFMLDNPEGLNRAHFNSVVKNPVFNYYRLQPWPTFINGKVKSELKTVCMKVFDLLKSIPERLFNYDFDSIAQYYELPGDFCRLVLEGIGKDFLDRMPGRGDFMISPDHGIRCIEYNANANLGGWEQDFLENIYASIPVISKFLTVNHLRIRSSYFLVNALEHILENALKHFGTTPEGKINTALVHEKYSNETQDGLDVFLKQTYKQVLGGINHQLEGELVICDFSRLNPVNESVRLDGKPIHVIIEWCMGKVPSWVMPMVKRGNLMLYNGPIMDIMANKLSLALLSEFQNSDLFNHEERETIKSHIPWSRKLIPGETTYENDDTGAVPIRLENFVISHQERLVLKAGIGYGGYQVIMGAEVPPSQWKQQVEKALSEKTWVVQEYIKPTAFIYQSGETGCEPHQVVWGVFLFGSRSPGGFVRVLPEKSHSHVINLNQGSEQSITLEVEE